MSVNRGILIGNIWYCTFRYRETCHNRCPEPTKSWGKNCFKQTDCDIVIIEGENRQRTYLCDWRCCQRSSTTDSCCKQGWFIIGSKDSPKDGNEDIRREPPFSWSVTRAHYYFHSSRIQHRRTVRVSGC